jgi:hypothetical protein
MTVGNLPKRLVTEGGAIIASPAEASALLLFLFDIALRRFPFLLRFTLSALAEIRDFALRISGAPFAQSKKKRV